MRTTPPPLLLLAAGLLLGCGAARAADDPDVFPGSVPDERETVALARSGGGHVRVLRTTSPFEVVLSYYRFKRKQVMHVTEERPADRLRAIASALESDARGETVGREPLVTRFHQFRFGRTEPDRHAVARAWRTLASRFEGQRQMVGEGQRVTLYRPYLSQCTFEPIDETVIILRTDGGQRHESTSSPGNGHCRQPDSPGGFDRRDIGPKRR